MTYGGCIGMFSVPVGHTTVYHYKLPDGFHCLLPMRVVVDSTYFSDGITLQFFVDGEKSLLYGIQKLNQRLMWYERIKRDVAFVVTNNGSMEADIVAFLVPHEVDVILQNQK